MKKIFFMLLIPILFAQCSNDFDGLEEKGAVTDETREAQMRFPKEADDFGKSVAENIRFIYKRMAQNDEISYSDEAEVQMLMKEYSEEFSSNKGIVRTRTTDSVLKSEVLISRIESFTNDQMSVLNSISEAKQKSKSKEEFMVSLHDINEYVRESVSEVEQKRLFMVISAVYYAVKEIISLESEGYLLGDNQYLPPIKTRAYEGDPTSGSITSWCSSGLSTVWLAAAIEPTPVGEIVATGASVVVGLMVLYEFTVKCISNSGSNKITKDDCIELFADCVDRVKLKDRECRACLEYCVSEGLWNCTRTAQYK